ncbi:MAG: hypothetical protein HY646_03175 [Acidobacteria bacterium]|nr:hypothetical protein [Acidobacteriota bacterium]
MRLGNLANTPRGLLGQFENLTGVQSNAFANCSLPLDIGILFEALHQLAVDPTRCVLLSRFTGNYIAALTLPLVPILHRECEYAIPVENTREALVRFKRIMEEGDFSTTLPVEIRFVAEDTSLLSPAHGRAVCYIGAELQIDSAGLRQESVTYAIQVTYWALLIACLIGGLFGGSLSFLQNRKAPLLRLLGGVAGGFVLSAFYVFGDIPAFVQIALARNTITVLAVSLVGGYGGASILEWALKHIKK